MNAHTHGAVRAGVSQGTQGRHWGGWERVCCRGGPWSLDTWKVQVQEPGGGQEAGGEGWPLRGWWPLPACVCVPQGQTCSGGESVRSQGSPLGSLCGMCQTGSQPRRALQSGLLQPCPGRWEPDAGDLDGTPSTAHPTPDSSRQEDTAHSPRLCRRLRELDL